MEQLKIDSPEEFLRSKRYVDLGMARVAYVKVQPEQANGEGGIPLLFIHGLPTHSFLWRKVLTRVANKHVSYAVDLMGMGDTEVDPRSDFSMTAQAEMLLNFMDAMGHDRMHVVAHDQGGAPAQIIATGHPQRVASLTLTNCVCYDNWPVPAVKVFLKLAALPGLYRIMRPGVILWWLMARRFMIGGCVRDRRALTWELIKEYCRPFCSTRERRLRSRNYLLEATKSKFTQDLVPELRKFDRPTAVIWSEFEPHFPRKWGEQLARDIPGTQVYHLLEGGGHFYQEEKPDEFVAVLLEFLDSVESVDSGS